MFKKLITETYTASKHGNMLEYGYIFAEEENPECSLFDIVLGEIDFKESPIVKEVEGQIDAHFEKFRETAEYIAMACNTAPYLLTHLQAIFKARKAETDHITAIEKQRPENMYPLTDEETNKMSDLLIDTVVAEEKARDYLAGIGKV